MSLLVNIRSASPFSIIDAVEILTDHTGLELILRAANEEYSRVHIPWDFAEHGPASVFVDSALSYELSPYSLASVSAEDSPMSDTEKIVLDSETLGIVIAVCCPHQDQLYEGVDATDIPAFRSNPRALSLPLRKSAVPASAMAAGEGYLKSLSPESKSDSIPFPFKSYATVSPSTPPRRFLSPEPRERFQCPPAPRIQRHYRLSA